MINFDKYRTIRGWFHDDEATWLYNLALGKSRILEVGAWEGRSTYALLSALRDTANSSVPRVVVSIDPYTLNQGPPYAELETENGRKSVIRSLKENLSEFKDTDVCHVLVKLGTPSAFSLFDSRSFDLCFIDGDHSYRAVCNDIKGALRLVRAGGIICGHDYRTGCYNEEVKQAVDELLPGSTIVGNCWQWLVPT